MRGWSQTAATQAGGHSTWRLATGVLPATGSGVSSPFMAGLIRSPAMDIAELQGNGRGSAERAERNPWIQVWRIVKAEAERTGDETLYEDFQRRFKRAERERWGPAG
jgi:hypothetical protein